MELGVWGVELGADLVLGISVWLGADEGAAGSVGLGVDLSGY